MSILLVGCGNLGRSILDGAYKTGAIDRNHLHIIQRSKREDIQAAGIYESITEVPVSLQPQIIIIAVKPKDFDEVLISLKAHFKSGNFPVIISLAAGKTVQKIKSIAGENAPVIRAMPNTPASIGMAVTAAYASLEVPSYAKVFAKNLFESIGGYFEIPDENWLNPITAISGSGPAYVFYFMELLIKSAVKHGLPIEFAREITQATFAGAVALSQQDGADLNHLRAAVTSKGGTTEAAITTMQNMNLDQIIESAIDNAIARAEDLCG